MAAVHDPDHQDPMDPLLWNQKSDTPMWGTELGLFPCHK